MKKAINRRLDDILEDVEFSPDHQFGFRRHRGCQEAIALAYERIALAKARGNAVRVILRDVKSAFDKVWHDGLVYKIKNIEEVPDTMTHFLKIFLTDRKARVVHNGVEGPDFALQAGVPQGSVLSPTLYNIYVRDLPRPLSNSSLYIIYADDVSQIV